VAWAYFIIAMKSGHLITRGFSAILNDIHVLAVSMYHLNKLGDEQEIMDTPGIKISE